MGVCLLGILSPHCPMSCPREIERSEASLIDPWFLNGIKSRHFARQWRCILVVVNPIPGMATYKLHGQSWPCLPVREFRVVVAGNRHGTHLAGDEHDSPRFDTRGCKEMGCWASTILLLGGSHNMSMGKV